MKKLGKLTSLLLALALMAGLACASAASASAAIAKWPSLSQYAYAESYSLATGNTPVYTTSALTTRGTSSPYQARDAVIYGTDVICVYSMTDTYAYVSYPIPGGSRCGYIRTGALSPNNMADFRATAKGKALVYNRPGGGVWDSIAPGDYVIGFATSGIYTQCFYTSRAGDRAMRLGWIRTADFDSYVRAPSPAVITTAPTTPTTTAKPTTNAPKPPAGKSSNPIGVLDAAAGGVGTVTVTGWAFDWDKVSAPLDIHVYIGGEAGTGEGHGNGVANQSRPDVNKVYVGAGDNHGFSHTVTTGKRGQQTVFVYAINASGTPGVNVLIGKATVDIKSAAPASYTVTYDANGGSGAPAAQTKTEGQDLKLAAALPSNGSLFFIAWNTKKDGTGDTYKPGDTYKANASVTLYAQWTPVKTGDLNGDGKVDYKDLQMLWQILRG